MDMETSVKRLQRLLALGASVAVLASQACNSSPPGGASASTASKSGSVPGDALVAKLPPTGAMTFTMAPAALPGSTFEVDVSFRDTTGALLDVPDVVTLSLASSPVTGAVLGGTLSKAAVHGVAAFTDLALATPGTGYVIAATSSQVSVSAVGIKTAPFKVAWSEDDQMSSGGVANSAIATAQTVSPNVPVFGTLGGGEVHYYKFAAAVGQRVAVTSYGNKLDLANWDTALRMRLIGPDGVTEIARSGAVSPKANSLDTGLGAYIPATGTYYLAADQDQGGFSSGKFGVLLGFVGLPSGATFQTETEPAGATGQNDTHATAQAFVPGVMFGHYDNAASNTSSSDYYKVSVTAASRLHFEIAASRLGSANAGLFWDPALSLEDSAGNVLWKSDNTFFLDPSIDYTVTTAGTYYVRVTRAEYPTNSASSPYFLSYTTTAYAPTKMTGTTTPISTAVLVAYGKDISGSFAAGGTQYFAFSGTAGDVVRLVLADKSGLQGVTAVLSSSAQANTVTPAGPTTGTIASPAGVPAAGANGLATLPQIAVASPIVLQSAPPSDQVTGVTLTPIPGQNPAPVPVPASPPPTIDASLIASDGATGLATAGAAGNATESKLITRQTILQATGKYFVKVTSSAAGTFGFRIDLVSSTTREVEPNDSASTASAVGTNGWASGVISSATDKDHFKVHGEAGQLVTVGLLAAAGSGMGTSLADWGSQLVPVVEVRDASGNLIAQTSADRKGQTNFAESTLDTDTMLETSFRAPSAADYDVTVYDADSQGGAGYFYALHVWKNQ
jgi:hypothetical protein